MEIVAFLLNIVNNFDFGQNWTVLANAVEFLSKAISRSPGSVACSDTLYFLFKVRRGRVIKYKPQGIYYRQRKEVVIFLALRARFARRYFWKEWKEK